MKHDFSKIIKLVEGAKSIAILPHILADGDAVGSSCALATFLTTLGKDTTVVYEEPVMRKISYITALSPEVRHIVWGDAAKENLPEFDLVITCDVSDEKRLGERVGILRNAPSKASIDHHVTANVANENVVCDPEWAATAEGVYELISELGYKPYGVACDIKQGSSCEPTCEMHDIKLDSKGMPVGKYPIGQRIAAMLYTSLVTDTGSFAYSNVTPDTLVCATALRSAAGNTAWIVEQTFNTRSLGAAKLIAYAYQNMTIYDGHISILRVTDEVLGAFGASDEECEGISSLIRQIEGVDIAIFGKPGKNAGEVKLSFRSGEAYDVAAIAREYNGGGHVRAAGATITVNSDAEWDKFVSGIVAKIRLL